MGAIRQISQKQISWTALISVVFILAVIGFACYGFVKFQDNQYEEDYKNSISRLKGMVDAEGEVDEGAPKIPRERLHEILGRKPDETGPYGKRLVDVYHWDGPLKRYRLSLRFEKTSDHKWVLNNAKTYWEPGKLRPHKDPLD